MRMLPAATLSNTEGEPCNKALFLSYSGGPRTFVLVDHTFSIKHMLDMSIPCNPSRCLRSVRSPQVVGSCQASDRFPWCAKNLQKCVRFSEPSTVNGSSQMLSKFPPVRVTQQNKWSERTTGTVTPKTCNLACFNCIHQRSTCAAITTFSSHSWISPKGKFKFFCQVS